MVFAYYKKLSRANQAIYRKSDRIESIPINRVELLYGQVDDLRQALETENRSSTEKAANDLINAIAADIAIPSLSIRILSSRPSNDSEELHGLYEPVENGKKARITAWMKTAKHKKVVAFRSFLRTLLHELCHHMDYELLLFEDSFHTEGFFKREAYMFRQLLNEEKV
jgi:hypothetical protein